MPDTLVDISDLSVSFGSTQVVSNVHLEIQKGKTTAIVGESGSGKSMTALSIVGLLPENAALTGSILVDGRNVVDATQATLRSIRGSDVSMIFQEPMTSLNPVFTIGEQIGEVFRYHQHISRKNARCKTVELLQEVGIHEERANSYPHEFSGGMRQRVMIAIALANRPRLLIADEPTTALDATTTTHIIELIRSVIQRRSMSLLFISHDLGVVSTIADSICVMKSGKIVERGETKTVLKEPKHVYTKALLACRPSMHDKKKRLLTIEE